MRKGLLNSCNDWIKPQLRARRWAAPDRSILKEEGASTAQTLLDAWLEGPQYDSLLPRG